MNKFSIALISDLIFCALLTFIILLTILAFFCSGVLLFIITFSLTLTLTFFYYKYFSKKHKNKVKSKKESIECEQVLTTLAFMKKPKVLSLYKKALTTKNYDCTISDGGILVKNKNLVVYPFHSFDGPTKTDVVRIYNSLESQAVAVIFAGFINDDVIAFCKRFNGRIKLHYLEQTYRFLKNAGTLPEVLSPFKTSPSKAQLFMGLFDKKRALKHTVFGLAFLFMSLFVHYKVYYVIVGCAFLILAVVCAFFCKTSSASTTDEIFD